MFNRRSRNGIRCQRGTTGCVIYDFMTLTDLSAGSTVHVRVTSVNQMNAESAPSEEVQIAA